MSQPRHLYVIDAETHEKLEEHPEVLLLQDEIKGLQRSLAAESRRYEQLARDKAQEAAEHELWPKAYAVFHAWRVACNHPKSDWPGKAGDRFWDIEPFLRNPKYGLEGCLRAVAGMAFDHFTVPRKNGTIRRFDEWSRIFKTTDEFEERANRAPQGWRDQYPYSAVLEKYGIEKTL